MLATTQGICLRTVPYSDTRAVLEVLTRQYGRLSVTMPLGQGPRARRRRALTRPMSPVEMVVDYQPSRSIMSVRELTPLPSHPTLAALSMSPVKTTLTGFLADVTGRLCRDAGPDTALYSYVLGAVDTLGAMPGSVANFHLKYLLGLVRVMGVAPDTSLYDGRQWLDMLTGQWTLTPPMHNQRLSPEQARWYVLLDTVPWHLLSRIPMTQALRRQALDLILTYIGLHLRAVNHIPSLAVMRSLY